MSEAMSSVEIEDVLSSIRRLVSEDLRPGPRSLTVATPPATGADAGVPVWPLSPVDRKTDDKLILTPAFRVVVPPGPAVLPRLHLGVEPATRVVSTLERAVEAQTTEWESEVGDPPLLINDMEWSENGWVTPLPAAQSAQVVQFVTLDATPIVDTTPQLETTPSWAQPEPEISEPEPSASQPIAEPDRHWADQAEAEAVAQLQADAQPKAEAGEMRLDEQVLRELVRELILAELQGTLGERITRNVRKLVRAEIARAISVSGVE